MIPLEVGTGELASNMTMIIGITVAVIIIGLLIAIAKFYKKAKQGEALVKTGIGGTKVSFTGMMVWPVIHNGAHGHLLENDYH